MRIEVTAEDIAKGKRRNCKLCPIALAIRRRIPSVRAEVHPERAVVIYPDGDLAIVELPNSAMDFIDHFDFNEPVAPFRFNLKFSEAR